MFSAFVFLDRCRIHSTLQRMQSIPVIRSQWCQREGSLALDCFVHKVAPMGPGLTLGCPTCTEAMRPKWLTQVVFFRGAEVIKFTASLKSNPNSPPSLISLSVGHRRQSPASALLWGSNGNASSPVLAPLHVSVSGNTLLSHRLGTLWALTSRSV